MTTKELIHVFKETISNSDINGFRTALESALETIDVNDINSAISDILIQNYERKKSEFFSVILQTILRTDISLGSINGYNNDYFRLCLFTGSFDMYECFIEEFVEPFYEGKEDQKGEYIVELYAIADKTIEYLFNNYEPSIKGIHFNGAFSRVEGQGHIVNILEEDYLKMSALVENYNKIIGRSAILKDLEERF